MFHLLLESHPLNGFCRLSVPEKNLLIRSDCFETYKLYSCCAYCRGCLSDIAMKHFVKDKRRRLVKFTIISIQNLLHLQSDFVLGATEIC